jgi:zinc/manganese transport system substrate-binding protein
MNKTVVYVLVLLSPIILAACGGPDGGTATQPEPGGKLRVVTTTLPLRALAAEVAGDKADVESILGAGVDAHGFQPRPGDAQMIARSTLVLKNGIGLDGWVDGLLESAGGERPVVTVTGGIPLQEGGHSEGKEGHEEETEGTPEGDRHEGEEGMDPHVWLDVTNAMTMTRNIRDALVEADPANAETYNANATSYLKKLEMLESEIKSEIATIPEGQRKMVTNHDAFGYYIRAYGLEFAGSIIPSMSTEAQPSAGSVAELIGKIKSENVKAIFLESSINPQLAQQIANDAGVTVVDDLYADTMGEPGTPTGTYEGMMRHNTERIVRALK